MLCISVLMCKTSRRFVNYFKFYSGLLLISKLILQPLLIIPMSETQYTEDNIRSLDWREHIRLRPGMYIGKLGDGSSADDGIYILLKEILDNSIDEFVMGSGKTIEIVIKDQRVVVRDYGRGIPLGKLVEVVSKMNTGG